MKHVFGASRTLLGLLAVLLAITSLLVSASTDRRPSLGIKDAKLTVLTNDGSTEFSQDLVPPKPLASAISLSGDHIVRINFQVTPSDYTKELKQAHFQFRDEEHDNKIVATMEATMRSNGKGRFDLKCTSVPNNLRSTSGRLSVTLLLGSPSTSPMSYTIGSLVLPSSRLIPLPLHRHDVALAKPQEGQPAFKPMEDIWPIFPEPEKEINTVIVAVAVVLVVVVPWLILSVFTQNIAKSLTFSAPPMSSYLYFGCLLALEGSILKYWINWKLHQFLPVFGAISVVSFYVGRVAMGNLKHNRLARGKKSL